MSDWEKLIPKPKSKFLRVKCPDCGNEQVVFDSTTNVVHCNICGATLAEPSAGRASIKGEIIAILD